MCMIDILPWGQEKVGKLRNQFWFCTALLCLKSHMSSDLQHHNHPLSCQHAIFENISNYDLKCYKWFLEIHWQVSILFNGNYSPQKCLACSYVNIKNVLLITAYIVIFSNLIHEVSNTSYIYFLVYRYVYIAYCVHNQLACI